MVIFFFLVTCVVLDEPCLMYIYYKSRCLLYNVFCFNLNNWIFGVRHDLHNIAATAGSNKAASSGTSLNTRKLDEDTENLAREW